MKYLLVLFFILGLGAVVTWLLFDKDAVVEPSNEPTQDVTVFETDPINLPTEVSEEQIVSEFESFLVSPTSEDVFSTVRVNGRPVALSQFADVLGGGIDSRFASFLDESAWQLYRCANTDLSYSASDIVLTMRLDLLPGDPLELYRSQMSALSQWERSLFNDLRPIIYPAEYYSGTPTLATSFIDNEQYPYISLFRQAIVRLDDGTDLQFAYLRVSDEVLVGNNIDCLLRAQELVFDTGA